MGQQGDDILYGEDGDDILIGGSNVAGALDGDDVIDGGAGNDAIAGDNAECCFRTDLLDPRIRALTGHDDLRHEHPGGNDGVGARRRGDRSRRQNDPTGHPPVPRSRCSTTATRSRPTGPTSGATTTSPAARATTRSSASSATT